MEWDVQFDDEFVTWFEGLDEALQNEIIAHANLLRELGPQLGRPYVDTVEGAAYTNMKEQRGGMVIRLDDYVAKRPKARQEAIEKRTAELLDEEATLRQVREARERSQEEVAKKLHIKQAAVSKLERRTDMYISTLRGFIEAMGGRLEIVARFPNQAVRITQFEALDPEQRPQD